MVTLQTILDAYNSLGPGTHQHKALTAKLEEFGHDPGAVVVAINQALAAGHLELTPMNGIRKTVPPVAGAGASGTEAPPCGPPSP